MKRAVVFHTFGCRLNQFETAALAEASSEAGFGVGEAPGDHIHVVNSCAVTGRSEADCRRLLRRISRKEPAAPIVVTGCWAERAPSEVSRQPNVRAVIGNGMKDSLVAVLESLSLGVTAPARRMGPAFFPEVSVFPGRTRATVKIQDGCDGRCSFCVVPMVRGPSRSESAERIVERVARLGAAGYREVILTGVHLGTWGADLAPPGTLAGLIGRLTALPDGPRLRLSSIEPREVTGELTAGIRGNARLCRHFHVPLQSGSDPVLEAMHRGYTAAFYRRILEDLAGAAPLASLGADVMAGFPGETRDDFGETVRFIRESPLTYLHVFAFSPRPGTPAADLPGHIPGPEIIRRCRVLRQLSREKSREWRAGLVGRTLDCLVEKTRDRAGGLLRGIADNGLPVLFPGPDTLMKTVVPVVVDAAGERSSHGHLAR
jgi:threonylcarbamoyladenosine tRNA methylthiotransferase MtaB